MPKIIVVIENTKDGQPIWDEASVKQLHDIVRPASKPHHRDIRDNYGDELPHYSSHQRETGSGQKNWPASMDAAKGLSAEEAESKLSPDWMDSGKYQFKA